MNRIAALFMSAVSLGCTSIRTTDPPRTATEQLLISTAADRAVNRLEFALSPDTKVHLITERLEAYDAKYLVSALRDRLLREGAVLVDDRSSAELVIEARSGALSINRNEKLLGIPAMPVPVPFATGFELPELALFKRDRQQGISKIALFATDAAGGRLQWSTGSSFGSAQHTRWVILLVGWTTSDLVPEDLSATVEDG